MCKKTKIDHDIIEAVGFLEKKKSGKNKNLYK